MTDQRTALVTGGASGIGRSAVLAFAKAGMNVVIVDLDGSKAQTVASEVAELSGQALAIECDATDENAVRSAVERTVARFSRLDILVTAAGVDFHKELEDIPLADWNRVMDVNVSGAFLFMKHARPLMTRNRFGRMICLGSSSGIYGMGWPAYSAAKAALGGLVLSAARELAPLGVTVNLVAPGPTETRLSLGLWAANPGRREKLEASVPVGRVARPEEIAAAIAYLASEDAGFVTGSTLTIDGGLTSLMPVARPAKN
jgi:NAD(P)-dependent dehydrogenase (short-subunit alcohol dehydrogenase family)